MPSNPQSRAASPKSSSSSRRPKLMRAAATSPSLAKSNASRQDLASLQDARAATLLTRVAINSSAQQPGGYRRQISCAAAAHVDGARPGTGCICMHVAKRMVLRGTAGNYFSFPSFEDFQEYRQQSERDQNGVD
ncbi:hypothetical protein PZA11_002572 [Diplocarpon coronariae]